MQAKQLFVQFISLVVKHSKYSIKFVFFRKLRYLFIFFIFKITNFEVYFLYFFNLKIAYFGQREEALTFFQEKY